MKLKNNKIIILTIIILTIFVISLISVACVYFAIRYANNNTDKNNGTNVSKPPIVDHFACSDYCPGPEEQYWVKIYEGVEDEDECRALGGRPYTYYGWDEYHICIVD